MGNHMANQDLSQILLNFNVAMLIGNEIVTTFLLIRLTKLLNVVDNSPILTPAQALKQRNNYVMFKTKAVLNDREAYEDIESQAKRIYKCEDQRTIQRALTQTILMRNLNFIQAELYYSASRSFKRQAQLNRFSIFRFIFRDCNIPKIYPSFRYTHRKNQSTSMFLSHNMVSLGKIKKNGQIYALYTGFNRQFIRKILNRQKQIAMIEFVVVWGMFLLHRQQLSNWYNYIRKQAIKLYRYLFCNDNKKRRKVEVGKDGTCIICYARPRNVIFVECKHFLLCDQCFQDVNNKLLGCPICRKNNKKPIKVQYCP